MAAASVPSTAALPRPGTRPLYTPARGGSRIPLGGGPGAPCPRTPAGALVPRSPRCPLGRAGEEGCARLAPRLGSRARPPAAPRSARGWTRRAASGFRVGRRRHDAGGGRARGQQLRRRQAGRGRGTVKLRPRAPSRQQRPSSPGGAGELREVAPRGPRRPPVGVRRGEGENSRAASWTKEGRVGGWGGQRTGAPQRRRSGEERRLRAAPLTRARNGES